MVFRQILDKGLGIGVKDRVLLLSSLEALGDGKAVVGLLAVVDGKGTRLQPEQVRYLKEGTGEEEVMSGQNCWLVGGGLRGEAEADREGEDHPQDRPARRSWRSGAAVGRP